MISTAAIAGVIAGAAGMWLAGYVAGLGVAYVRRIVQAA